MGRAFITHSSTGGIPIGGTTGQVLTKRTDNSFDMEWTTLNAETLQDAENILFYCGTNSSGDYIFGTYDKWLEAGSPQPPSTTMVIPKAGGLTTVYVNNTPIAGINLDNALILLNEQNSYIEVDTLASVISQLIVKSTEYFTYNGETYGYPPGSTWETWIADRDDNLFKNDSGTVNINTAEDPSTTENWQILRGSDGEPIAATSVIQEATYYTDGDFYTVTLDANGGSINKTEYRLLKTGDTTLSLPTPTPPEDEDVEFLGWVGADTELKLTGSSTDTSMSLNGDSVEFTSNTQTGSFELTPSEGTDVIRFDFYTDASSLLDLSLSLAKWKKGTIGEKIYSSGDLFKGYTCACEWNSDMEIDSLCEFSVTPATTANLTYVKVSVSGHKALLNSIEVTHETELQACWGRPLQRTQWAPEPTN